MDENKSIDAYNLDLLSQLTLSATDFKHTTTQNDDLNLILEDEFMKDVPPTSNLDRETIDISKSELNMEDSEAPKENKKLNLDADLLADSALTDNLIINKDTLQDTEDYNELENVKETVEEIDFSNPRILLLKSIINSGLPKDNNAPTDVSNSSTITSNMCEGYSKSMLGFYTNGCYQSESYLASESVLNSEVATTCDNIYEDKEIPESDETSKLMTKGDLLLWSIMNSGSAKADNTPTNVDLEQKNMKSNDERNASSNEILEFYTNERYQSKFDIFDIPKKESNLNVSDCSVTETVLNFGVEIPNETLNAIDSLQQNSELPILDAIFRSELNDYNTPKKPKKKPKKKKNPNMNINNSLLKSVFISDLDTANKSGIFKDLLQQYKILGTNVDNNSTMELNINAEIVTENNNIIFKKTQEDKSIININCNKSEEEPMLIVSDKPENNAYTPIVNNYIPPISSRNIFNKNIIFDLEDIESNETNTNNEISYYDDDDTDFDYCLVSNLFDYQDNHKLVNIETESLNSNSSQHNLINKYKLKNQKKCPNFDKWVSNKYKMGFNEYISMKSKDAKENADKQGLFNTLSKSNCFM